MQHQDSTSYTATPGQLSAAGLRAFFTIAEKWCLDNAQQMTLLGSPSRSTFFCWKKGGSVVLCNDQLDRISYVLGIYKSLHLMFGSAERADG